MDTETHGSIADRLRDLADEIEQTPAAPTAGLTPIPGNDLQVGDRLWTNTDDLLVVERVGIANGPKVKPLLVAYGTKQYGSWKPGVTCSAQEPFFGGDWVVVER